MVVWLPVVTKSAMFLWVCLAVVACVGAQDAWQVDLTHGPVVGYRSPNENVFAFYGIPFATAPTGRDRFKAPLPAPVFTEPFQAVQQHIACPQYGSHRLPGFTTVTEACLVANVFVPNTNETNLPVLFMVHGGGFLVGYGNSETPKQFVESKNIVTVTFNYRLGPHGFLCMGTAGIPGNAGMKDQLAALRWTRDNIARFRGNPDDITIAGCSAGGAAVDLLMLSKATAGLFHKAIPQSGANVASFAVQVDPIENAEYYAAQINFTGGDLQALEEFYRTVPYDQFLSYSLELNRDHAVKMSPCIERDLGQERFLEDGPVNILRSGDYVRYPMLYGFTNMEGLLRIGEFQMLRREMNEDFAPFVPADLQFESAEEKRAVAEEIRQFYFGNNEVTNASVLNYIDFFSDAMFIYPMQKSVQLQVEAGNNDIYLSVYSFTDENTPFVPYTNEQGANHCMQVFLLFDENYNWLTPEYIAMKERVREWWANFIRTGNPTPEGATLPRWDPTHANGAPCMHIGRAIELQGAFAPERTAFWNRIYSRYYRHPVAPSSAYLTTVNPLLILVFLIVQTVSFFR